MTVRTPRAAAPALAALLFALACGGGGGEGRGERPGRGDRGDAPTGVSPDQRVLVEVEAAASGSVADHLVTTGVLESEAQADISPQASGTVTRIYVEEGDTVSRGQLLASIDNVSLNAGADRATIELEKARQSLREAESLHSRGAISNRELRDAQDAVRIAEASYGESRAGAGFTRLTSPISGTVSLRNVRVGEVAGPGAPAFQVVDLDKLRVIVQLPEKDLPRIQQGLSVELSGAYDEDAAAMGTIQRISPVIDATSGTVRVTVAVDPDQATLRPGQFVKARIEVDRHEDVLTIPRRALVWEDGEPIAWAVVDAPPPEAPEEGDGDGEDEGAQEGDEGRGFFAGLFGGGEDGGSEDVAASEDDTDPWEGIPRRGVSKRRLEIGYVDPDKVEIQEGLEAGELVITLGNNAIRPEALVRLPDDPDPPDEDAEEGADKGDDASAGGAEPPEGAAPADADEAGDDAGQPEGDKASDGEG